MALLRDQEDLVALCGAAGEIIGVPASVIEKDYWVTQALRALQLAHPGEFIFKGGTSLSKAYGLIERFSEDIDLLVVAPQERALPAAEEDVRHGCLLVRRHGHIGRHAEP